MARVPVGEAAVIVVAKVVPAVRLAATAACLESRDLATVTAFWASQACRHMASPAAAAATGNRAESHQT